MGGRGSGSRNGSREFVFGLQVEGEELAVRNYDRKEASEGK